MNCPHSSEQLVALIPSSDHLQIDGRSLKVTLIPKFANVVVVLA